MLYHECRIGLKVYKWTSRACRVILGVSFYGIFGIGMGRFYEWCAYQWSIETWGNIEICRSGLRSVGGCSLRFLLGKGFK